MGINLENLEIWKMAWHLDGENMEGEFLNTDIECLHKPDNSHELK